VSKAPFVIVPELTAIAVAYAQKNLIADLVLPRVPVNAKEFTWTKYALGEAFTVPETLVGRRGQPNQVEFTGDAQTSSVVDHALDSPVPNDDFEQWEKARTAGLTKAASPLMRATTQVTSLVATRREKRVADLVFGDTNYGTNNKTTLSGTDQWSDYVNSDPHVDVLTALDTMIMRPNYGVLGRRTATVLSLNPKIKAAIYGDAGSQKAVTRRALADLFELEDIFVGEGWMNLAAKGQPVNMQRIWGAHAAFININAQADTEMGISFGMTAQFGGRVAGTIEDSDIGMRGGKRVRSGESVKEFLCANDLGYLFKNAVSAA